VRPWTASRLLAVCGASAAFWAVLAGLCLLVGSTGWGRPSTEQFAARWPNVAVASLVGAALAAAGLAFQAVLRNPLAEPYLLGVSGGASLAAYIAAISTGPLLSWLEPIGQQAASFIGAMLALMMVLLLSQRRGRLEPVTLLLVGVIVSAICGATYLLIFHLNLRREVSFGTGGSSRFLVGAINTNLTAAQIGVAGVLIAAGWTALLYMGGKLNVASLSDAEAESLGLRIHRLRWVTLIIASLITAAATALSGPIAFVGLICPNVARLVVGGDQRRLLPVATALGASLLAIADALSRLLTHQTGFLPVGVLTGLLGGPFFLLLLWRGRWRQHAG
jgi:iron complex transport system permease protein